MRWTPPLQASFREDCFMKGSIDLLGAGVWMHGIMPNSKSHTAAPVACIAGAQQELAAHCNANIANVAHSASGAPYALVTPMMLHPRQAAFSI